MISIQQADFSVAEETEKLRKTPRITGAICCFTGLVREFGDRPDLTGMFLEHYPGMTEKSLQTICDQARSKWDLQHIRLIHRVGELGIGEQIVFVGIASAHRSDAFSACEFIMDYLKVQAPFWKKERGAGSEHWVDAKESDTSRATRWQPQPSKPATKDP